MVILEQELLSRHTTFRIGGPATFYMIPEQIEEVKEAIAFAKEKGLSFYILGKGSNMLFSDEGYNGVIIEIGKGLEKVEIKEDGVVTVQAGTSMSVMAAKLADEGFTGFEFAAGIPGTLGGGIAMNAGAYGGEIKDCIQDATVLTEDGDMLTLSKEELELGYRTSIIQKKQYIVLSATFSFEKGNVDSLAEKLEFLLKDNDARQRYQNEAQAFICKKYNWDDVVKETLELYQ